MTATVVLLPFPGAGVPPAAFPHLRGARAVYASGLGEELTDQLGAKPAPEPAVLAAETSVVLFAASAEDPAVRALPGARVIAQPTGARLVEAAQVMDRLRSPGGCPWDAEQTHSSLRQYLVEETYELLEAIEDGDRTALREELGDVLLQVLFHARVAAEDAEDPFDVDAVAGELVAKLVGRHPHVFAESERVATAEHQELRWEELKQVEKQRESIVDGVALGQPAAALAGKLGQRTGRAGVPLDLFPGGQDAPSRLFVLAATARRAGVDPEGELRAVAKRFAADVRAAEANARAAGVEPSTLEVDGWRRFWP
ncbi:XTP/dITP diphosphohydrolase [Amycolatopsis bartoniae]|uniref:Nucleoside triphosphate pyrophosphohydrolase n=1 Tax=Amycolatopsis bartoniae TaxID=941986 RepID=A0A8H9IS47_9PSEU|nr:MazG family protein [Amycolatopsis bartoniae]MBB2934703.1 XTP/dITP diphosphohydrolase [Amycolatopsis bartoniae]TVT09354.1 MazG family protein [Amycolatopsis bartoniae]GHF45379.1 nucleoside triphosphate pyrophosphohydrolase [Amycolatopsis bartoniae]